MVVSASDPLNLIGSLLPGAKVPAVGGNRLLYRDGVPVAVRVAGRYSYLVDATAQEQEAWKQKLLRTPTGFSACEIERRPRGIADKSAPTFVATWPCL